MNAKSGAVSSVKRYYVRGDAWRREVGEVTQPCDCTDPCIEVVKASDYDAVAAALDEACKSCGCTLRERDSGHKIDCQVPQWRALLEAK